MGEKVQIIAGNRTIIVRRSANGTDFNKCSGPKQRSYNPHMHTGAGDGGFIIASIQ